MENMASRHFNLAGYKACFCQRHGGHWRVAKLLKLKPV
jgi:hypothetical protein